VHSIRLQKKSPIVHRFPSHEPDEPYRWSNSLIVRLPGTHYGFVVGLWRATNRTEEQTLLEALQGRHMDTESFLAVEEKAKIRRNMIKKQISASDQELLVEVLDL